MFSRQFPFCNLILLIAILTQILPGNLLSASRFEKIDYVNYDELIHENDRNIREVIDCNAPKDVGTCSQGYKQYFYYDQQWESCFAFKYSGCGGNSNRFTSRQQCESECLHADGSACRGPAGSTPALKESRDCTDDVCPAGYRCTHGMMFVECCNSTTDQYVKKAYAKTCPDGTQAGGIMKEYFLATFAKSCADLLCEKNEHCVQVAPMFAKCCQKTPKF